MERKKLLLHICCAPDASTPWPELIAEGYDAAGFFYGGNIQPRGEYEKRAEALSALALHTGAEVFSAPYLPERWLVAVEGLEDEPERGARCAVCFRVQLEAAARFASENGFPLLCTTLTISPHKDVRLINEIGAKLCAERGLTWLERIWRKKEGFRRSVEESKRLGLYRQNYCGCLFSLRSRAESGVKQQ
ncbi:MAG: epoxyqueuosine reductase QueH [Synergistaceae bacterium]|nr:epoxyqueuosine reductase QueH [Synergistaceae bacterium]